MSGEDVKSHSKRVEKIRSEEDLSKLNEILEIFEKNKHQKIFTLETSEEDLKHKLMAHTLAIEIFSFVEDLHNKKEKMEFRKALKTTLETSVKDQKTTLETSGEDDNQKTTLETSGEDANKENVENFQKKTNQKNPIVKHINEILNPLGWSVEDLLFDGNFVKISVTRFYQSFPLVSSGEDAKTTLEKDENKQSTLETSVKDRFTFFKQVAMFLIFFLAGMNFQKIVMSKIF
jgi:hypothetical protein